MENPYSGIATQEVRLVDLGSLHPWSQEIGEHSVLVASITRERGMGFARTFGLPDLTTLVFEQLAENVEAAFRATQVGHPREKIPTHPGWQHQVDYLRQWVSRGEQGIYALVTDQPHERFIRIIPHPSGGWILREGHHRCLALWILGIRKVWAVVGEFDPLWYFVHLHRRRVHRNVFMDMKVRRLTWADPSGFRDRVLPTGCFNCDDVSKEVERDLRKAGVAVVRQRGGFAFNGEELFSLNPDHWGDWHEWLVVPGRCLVLDFTIGYHLFARGKIGPDQLRRSFAPLCVREPRLDLQYLPKLVYEPNGNQKRLDSPRPMW